MNLIKKIFMMPLNTVKKMSAKQSIFFYQVNIHQVLINNPKCKDQVQGLQLSCNKIREVSQRKKRKENQHNKRASKYTLLTKQLRKLKSKAKTLWLC